MTIINPRKGEFDSACVEEKSAPLGRKMYIYDGRFQIQLSTWIAPGYFEMVDLKWDDVLLSGDYLVISRVLGIDVNKPREIAEALFLGLFPRLT